MARRFRPHHPGASSLPTGGFDAPLSMKPESPPTSTQGPEAFVALINATCELVGVAPADTWLDVGANGYLCATFQIDGIGCIVSHRPTDPDALFIHCVFGPVPVVRGAEALLALLQLNLALHGERSPVFGADTEHNLLLCADRRLHDLHASHLAQILESQATQALAWRKVWLPHE